MSNHSQAFKAKVELKFNYKKNESANTKTIKIVSDRIQYILLKYEYESVNVLPVVYVSLKVPMDLHDKILGTYQSSTFYLKITRKNGLSNTSASVKTVDDIFEYVSANNNVNQSPVLTQADGDDKSYVTTTIGMTSKNMSEKLRESFSGNYMETDTKTLINDVALKGMNKVIMSPLAYNIKYPKFPITSQNTRYKMLKYIFDDAAFYDTNFTFFMDFDKTTYLIANDGKPVDSGGKSSKCVINITDAVDDKSFLSGNEKKSDAYNLYINSSSTNVNVNAGLDKSVNKVVSYGYNTGEQSLYVGGAGGGNKDKAAYTRSDNAAVKTNDVSNNRVSVEFFKSAIDSSILTPNKTYIINHLSNYKKYNGNYFLSYKSESYTPMADDEFTITTSAGFKLVSNIVKANTTENKRVQNRYDEYSRETSASQGNGGSVQIANRAKSSDTSSSNSMRKA